MPPPILTPSAPSIPAAPKSLMVSYEDDQRLYFDFEKFLEEQDFVELHKKKGKAKNPKKIKKKKKIPKKKIVFYKKVRTGRFANFIYKAIVQTETNAFIGI